MSSNSNSPFPNAEPPTNLTLVTPKSEPVDENPPQFQPPAASPPPSADVYSEFNRISELFRRAFNQTEGAASALPDSHPDSRAIVLVPDPQTQASDVVVVPEAPGGSKKYPTRSSELVRVTDLKPNDQSYFRDLIRRARMLFDSLSVFAVSEEEKNFDPTVNNRKPRGDLKASALMRQSGLWMNRDKRVVGDIPGISIGDVFFFRMEMCVVGLHGQPQAGIDYVPAAHSSNGEPIATSVIVSGGYEDDEDSGDVLVYTGHGGQDKNLHKQVVHQKLESGNLAMERSMNYGIEVRVIRGFRYGGSASGKVYVYDGLYRIVDTWFDVGKAGFGVFKFKLVRIENQPDMGSVVMKFAESLRTRPLEVRPQGYVTLDLSKKKENFPVYFYNDVDGDHSPVYFEYLVTTVFPPYVYSVGGSGGCECVDGCRYGCFCAMKNGGEIAYNSHGILLRGKPLIFECGPHCRCPPTCRNRVSQKGVRNRLEVFRSRETGWGVRSLDLIQAGSFICEYTGVVLTHEQARLFTMNGDCLVYPGRFGHRWKEWGDLSQIFSDYVCPSYPSGPPLDFAMDVSRMRNVACYMSNSSSPNVFVQHVLYDHNNVSFPHLMLFAMENIPPMRELSLDYGVADEWNGKLAICH
ncbi:histone-lysine N-methyltransferase family member SUVH9-like [Salvia hispanica]|uniref:histone-lysine N-methyltransferase family member SUVH9-like n=1 Tax=Salvia hispanica TaxID=49212 RepID=UPI0020094568|nr:histone-lysine N-methyltransferase family member SUVH9-like [Salvia hispanica]XP_047951844.1 histone-lysine N-methyltransferase family member SUVH9-like [Salvia hispanica]XP_047951846.1 histone-lysine N-methyltransferase family member SUVH9-like [Salvia hispanica]XP_047951847.1 histone-lysine N-methyltransferase family member SUVH9-like [Salvia hispanica]